MVTSARCASGARSPEAPTEPREGMDRMDAGMEQGDQGLDDNRPAAGVAFGQHIGPQRQ